MRSTLHMNSLDISNQKATSDWPKFASPCEARDSPTTNDSISNLPELFAEDPDDKSKYEAFFEKMPGVITQWNDASIKIC
jgi:hypothetical protein